MEGFHQPNAKTSPAFEPLTELVKQYASGKFEAMPVGLRERIAQAFFPMSDWDQLAPDQRKSLAKQDDVQNNPPFGSENEYWWRLTCKTQEVELEIKRWKLMSDQGVPSEAVTKRIQLDNLRDCLAGLNSLWNCPPFTIKDWEKPLLLDSTMLRSETLQSKSPWLVIDLRDPPPEQAWYTPARYFARQLVKNDSTLLLKTLILADKVSKSLDKVGIKKRGGIKPFTADTMLKAFSNVKLG